MGSVVGDFCLEVSEGGPLLLAGASSGADDPAAAARHSVLGVGHGAVEHVVDDFE